MTVREILLTAAQKQGLTLTEIGRKAGLADGNIYRALRNSDGQKMQIDSFIKLIDALDCQILIDGFALDEELVLDGESEL